MKFHREQTEGRHAFTGYGEGFVAVNGTRHAGNLVVSGDSLVPGWTAATRVEDIAADELAALRELRPEIVLLGTGPRFDFPHPRMLAPLREAGIGVEVMDTPAACRTYNILLAEGRNVVAALIIG